MTELLHHGLGHAGHVVGIGHVGFQGERPSPERFDVVLDLLRLVDALQVDDGDVGAFFRHRPRVRGADSLRRTGDDADLVEQPVAHQSSPSTASTAPLTGAA